MKKLYWKLTLAALVCLLHGCKSSSGGSSGVLAPQTLDLVVLAFPGGAVFRFNADATQTVAGVETGEIVYVRNSANVFPISGTIAGGLIPAWPLAFNNGRYSYDLAGTDSGRIDFTGDSVGVTNPLTQASILEDIDAASGATGEIVLIYEPFGANSVSLASMTVNFPAVGGVVPQGGGSIRLTDGGFVPRGYEGDRANRPSERTDGIFDDDLIGFDDPNNPTSRIRILFDALVTPIPGGPVTESGIATFTDTVTMVTVQANYSLSQPLGTDTVIMTLEFVSTNSPADPFAIRLINLGTDVYTLFFSSSTSGNSGTFTAASDPLTVIEFNFVEG